MSAILDTIDARLLGEWQRGFPLVPEPFARIGALLEIPGAAVQERLARLAERGAISRVGATLRPNTAGASTLAALRLPELMVDEIAEIIGAEPGVNHSYLRENDWNLWFVVTGPDRAHVDATLARIGRATGLAPLDLPMLRPYHIDLGFALDGAAHVGSASTEPDTTALRPGDEDLLQALTRGLAMTARPYAALGQALGRSEAEVIERIASLTAAGIIARLGVIVRHRALGWRANAMVVWQLPEAETDAAGMRLAAQPGVTLCYRRRPDPRHWPYNLYCMIHARSRGEALDWLGRAAAASGLDATPRQVLFSLRCFKQTGALVTAAREAAA